MIYYDELKGKYFRYCPSCNNTLYYSRKDHCQAQIRLESICKPCASKKYGYQKSLGMYGPINIAWFNTTRKNAIARNLEFSIELEDILNLYKKQNGLCALSNVEIYWESPKEKAIHTASVDRIDSDIGYTKSNIQLVHKHVNFMKQDFDQEYFINFCKLIASNMEANNGKI